MVFPILITACIVQCVECRTYKKLISKLYAHSLSLVSHLLVILSVIREHSYLASNELYIVKVQQYTLRSGKTRACNFMQITQSYLSEYVMLYIYIYIIQHCRISCKQHKSNQVHYIMHILVYLESLYLCIVNVIRTEILQ